MTVEAMTPPQRAARTRKVNRTLSTSAYGRVLLALRDAQAASDRAKSRAANGCARRDYSDGGRYEGANYYRSRRARDGDYRAKEAAIAAAIAEAQQCGVAFGWRRDGSEWAPWIVYFELPTGQVSFHCVRRGTGPDYAGQWDGVRQMSGERVAKAMDAEVSILELLRRGDTSDPVPQSAVATPAAKMAVAR